MSAGRRAVKKPYRAALVGCGRVGYMLDRDPLRPKPCTHAGGVAAHPDFRLVAGCDIDPARLADFGKTYGLGKSHLHPRVEDLLKTERIDLLCVATWTQSHDIIVRQACRAGVPVVICEKPMAVTCAKARAMTAAARRAGTLLLINHSRRWASDYRTVRRAIEEERYGKLRHIQGCVLTSFGMSRRTDPTASAAASEPSWHAVLEKSGGGPLLHDGTHLIDIVFFLTGRRPAWIEGRIERHPSSAIEHHALGRIMFEGEEPLEFCFEAGGGRSYFHFEVELWFDEGRITIGNGIRIAERSITSRRYTGFRDLSPDPEFTWDPDCGTAEKVSMEELSRWFSRRDIPNNVSQDALLSQEAIFALYESALRSRRIFFPYRPTVPHPLLIGKKR